MKKHIVDVLVTNLRKRPQHVLGPSVDRRDLDRISSDLIRATAIVGDNVMDYMIDNSVPLSNGGFDYRRYLAADSFPCVAPPFDDFWVCFNSGKGHPGCVFFSSQGVLSVGGEVLDWLLRSGYKSRAQLYALGVKWVVTCSVFWLGQDRIPFYSEIEAIFLVKEDGGLLGERWDAICAFRPSRGSPAEWEWGAHGALVSASLLTLSFIHCRNVEYVEHTARQIKRKRKGKVKTDKITFKTLKIEPVKRILESEGRVEQVGLQQAMHICRGHFKDYRKNGLFGKHKDIYWWDHHARGSEEYGTVIKDYEAPDR